MYFYKFLGWIVFFHFGFALASYDIDIIKSTLPNTCIAPLKVGSHALLEAIRSNHYSLIRQALRSGVDVNTIFLNPRSQDSTDQKDSSTTEANTHKEPEKTTALHEAVKIGNPHIVNLLLEFGAKTQTQIKVTLDKDQQVLTAFSLIAYSFQEDLTDMELMVESFVHAQDATEESTKAALYHAVMQENIHLAKFIMEHQGLSIDHLYIPWMDVQMAWMFSPIHEARVIAAYRDMYLHLRDIFP